MDGGPTPPGVHARGGERALPRLRASWRRRWSAAREIEERLEQLAKLLGARARAHRSSRSSDPAARARAQEGARRRTSSATRRRGRRSRTWAPCSRTRARACVDFYGRSTASASGSAGGTARTPSPTTTAFTKGSPVASPSRPRCASGTSTRRAMWTARPQRGPSTRSCARSGATPSVDPELAGTGERVASRVGRRAALGVRRRRRRADRAPASSRAPPELVVVRDVPVSTICPHHLMASSGEATVAFAPARAPRRRRHRGRAWSTRSRGASRSRSASASTSPRALQQAPRPALGRVPHRPRPTRA